MKLGISIIIPTFNRELFIEETINSVLNQKINNKLEIIISDDGSTDTTLDICRQFGPKIKIFEKPKDCKDQGVAANRNRGIYNATQPLIAFLDSDDIYLEGHLYRALQTLENNDNVFFVFCRSLEFKIENNQKYFRPWTRDKIYKNDIKNLVISRSKIVNTNTLVFRKHVFNTVGFFNEELINGEDGDMWIRVSEKFNGYFLNHYGCAYRTNHGINQLTKNQRIDITLDANSVFQQAFHRYYSLKLNDTYRIFKIRYNLLKINSKINKNARSKYILKYFVLLLLYPSAFYHKIKEDRQMKKESKNIPSWKALDYFSN